MSGTNGSMWDEDDYHESEFTEEAPQENVYEEAYEEVEEDVLEDFDGDIEGLFETDELSLMDSARIRLEQGRLYEMLIKHDLFDGVEAAPEAIVKVQDEIKGFIMDRLEILLGMKSEKETEIHISSPSQFNDMEVKALKMIASKVTKGASVEAPTSEPEESVINTVKKVERPRALNALGAKKKTVLKNLVKKTITPNKSVKKAEPLRKKPKKGSKKKRVKKEVLDYKTGGKSAHEIAMKDMKYLESLKNMSIEEKDAIVAQRHSKPRAKVNINQDAVNSNYQTKMALNTNAGRLTNLILNARKA